MKHKLSQISLPWLTYWYQPCTCNVNKPGVWSIAYVSTSAATNFVYYKQSVGLLTVHGDAATIFGQSSKVLDWLDFISVLSD